MTELHLKLHQPMAHGWVEAGAVATVRLLADAKGQLAKDWWASERPVVVSGGDGSLGSPTVFDLPAGGRYGVSITLPRGADVERELVLAEGEVRKETITLAASPHEYLGWQQYAGIVRPNPYRPESQGGLEAIPVSRDLRLDSMMTRGRERVKSFYDRAKDEARVFSAQLPSSAAAWDRVREAASGGGRDWARAGGSLPWPAQTDTEYTTWFPKMPSSGESFDLIEGLKSPAGPPLASSFPRWISFEAGGEIDLGSVPWAWGTQGQDEEIRFLFDRIRPSPVDRDAPGHLILGVQDRRWFGLLEFLGSGRLYRAGGILESVREDAERGLYDKLQRPLVAVAGAIVLVASATSNEQQYWDPWLDNLSNWFPGIPDGSILLGCRRVQQAGDLDQLKKAYDHLKSGIARGIPFFSACIRMLGIALAQVGDAIAEADADRRFIAAVASRVDPQQPFTVIRLSS